MSRPVGDLEFRESIYMACIHQLDPQQPPSHPQYNYLNCSDFGDKTIHQHLVSFLLNGHLKKILNSEYRYAAIAIAPAN